MDIIIAASFPYFNGTGLYTFVSVNSRHEARAHTALRIQTYTEQVPLKYTCIENLPRNIRRYFYSVLSLLSWTVAVSY